MPPVFAQVLATNTINGLYIHTFAFMSRHFGELEKNKITKQNFLHVYQYMFYNSVRGDNKARGLQ